MNTIFGLCLTLILGLCVLLGVFIVKLLKNSDKFLQFSISLGITVMVLLSLFELIPEALDNVTSKLSVLTGSFIVLIFVFLGIIVLRLLDYFIPDHETTENKTSANSNLYHIGIMSSIAILIHNIIEGMAVYATTISSYSMGILVSIGVGIHNIAMGIVIYSTLSKTKKSRIEKAIMLGLVIISTFVGGLLVVINEQMVNNVLALGILLSITTGMLIYIVIFELLPKFIESKNTTAKVFGILMGIITMTISFLI